MSVIVSHPQTQHSYQVARALAEAELLERLYTSCFYDPHRHGWLPQRLRRELRKRCDPAIPPEKVSTFPWLELLWHGAGRIVGHGLRDRLFYYNVWGFDAVIARHIVGSSASIMVGYENSCRDTFRAAKKKGMLCVLDAASVHYRAQREVYAPPYSAAFLEQVNRRKDEEIRLADRILTLSGYARETYLEAGVPDRILAVIPPGVDVRRFRKKSPRPVAGAFTYLFVGNLRLSKGVDTLLAAFARLAIPDATLAIAGAPADAASLLRGAGNRVNYLGHLSPAELEAAYHAADVFILPSRLDGFGLVVAEAMATGTPVIVSSRTGARDLVVDGVNGWIFPAGDAGALAAAMARAHNERSSLAMMGTKARETAGHHTWEAYREEIKGFYGRLS